MWNFFNTKPKTNAEEELKGLLKAQEMLDKRFGMKQMDNETYIKKSQELRKKIEKCRKRLDEQ